MNTVDIKTEHIKLAQVLKLSGIVGQGSDAKMLISEGLVTINDVIHYERGKKVYNGDIVKVKGSDESVIVKCT